MRNMFSIYESILVLWNEVKLAAPIIQAPFFSAFWFKINCSCVICSPPYTGIHFLGPWLYLTKVPLGWTAKVVQPGFDSLSSTRGSPFISAFRRRNKPSWSQIEWRGTGLSWTPQVKTTSVETLGGDSVSCREGTSSTLTLIDDSLSPSGWTPFIASCAMHLAGLIISKETSQSTWSTSQPKDKVMHPWNG